MGRRTSSLRSVLKPLRWDRKRRAGAVLESHEPTLSACRSAGIDVERAYLIQEAQAAGLDRRSFSQQGTRSLMHAWT